MNIASAMTIAIEMTHHSTMLISGHGFPNRDESACLVAAHTVGDGDNNSIQMPHERYGKATSYLDPLHMHDSTLGRTKNEPVPGLLFPPSPRRATTEGGGAQSRHPPRIFKIGRRTTSGHAGR